MGKPGRPLKYGTKMRKFSLYLPEATIGMVLDQAERSGISLSYQMTLMISQADAELVKTIMERINSLEELIEKINLTADIQTHELKSFRSELKKNPINLFCSIKSEPEIDMVFAEEKEDLEKKLVGARKNHKTIPITWIDTNALYLYVQLEKKLVMNSKSIQGNRKNLVMAIFKTKIRELIREGGA